MENSHFDRLKSLQDRYFVDEFSRVSLKILVYGLEFIIALVENPIEQGNLENRLDLINNVKFWDSTVSSSVCRKWENGYHIYHSTMVK